MTNLIIPVQAARNFDFTKYIVKFELFGNTEGVMRRLILNPYGVMDKVQVAIGPMRVRMNRPIPFSAGYSGVPCIVLACDIQSNVVFEKIDHVWFNHADVEIEGQKFTMPGTGNIGLLHITQARDPEVDMIWS